MPREAALCYPNFGQVAIASTHATARRYGSAEGTSTQSTNRLLASSSAAALRQIELSLDDDLPLAAVLATADEFMSNMIRVPWRFTGRKIHRNMISMAFPSKMHPKIPQNQAHHQLACDER